MAHMNQNKKAAIAPQIKAVLKKYRTKGTVAVRHYSTLVVNISESELDLVGAADRWNEYIAERRSYVQRYVVEDNFDVNPFHEVSNMREIGEDTIADFYEELIAAMNGAGSGFANHDNSDIQTDYFDVGWYVDINVGKWNKPFIYTGEAQLEAA